MHAKLIIIVRGYQSFWSVGTQRMHQLGHYQIKKKKASCISTRKARHGRLVHEATTFFQRRTETFQNLRQCNALYSVNSEQKIEETK